VLKALLFVCVNRRPDGAQGIVRRGARSNPRRSVPREQDLAKVEARTCTAVPRHLLGGPVAVEPTARLQPRDAGRRAHPRAQENRRVSGRHAA
jgi:hypothetical protein